MTPTSRRRLFVLLALQREWHDLDALRSAAPSGERAHSNLLILHNGFSLPLVVQAPWRPPRRAAIEALAI